MARLQDQMFTGKDFVFSVSRDFVRTLPTPLLVLSGTDAFHPSGTSKEIVRDRIIAEIIRATHPRWSELRHDMFARAGAAGAKLRADRGLEEPRGDRGGDGEGGGLHAGARRKLPGRQPLASGLI